MYRDDAPIVRTGGWTCGHEREAELADAVDEAGQNLQNNLTRSSSANRTWLSKGEFVVIGGDNVRVVIGGERRQSGGGEEDARVEKTLGLA